MTLPRVKEIFLEAIAEPAEERCTVISRACAGDAVLRAEVELLLNHHEQAGQFLGTPNPEDETINVRSRQAYAGSRQREAPGAMIGRYQLLQKIGEGGFGTVWMAEQREPVTRQVALKIVKLGMDTHQVIARFEAERQALAMMDHTNIARVFDAGATETGRPYFVMELCTGQPIAAYCDDHNMSIAQRLQLFVQVCAAVQYAHQKGVIHRDIKPSNILVSTQDGRPSAKVIDFGIAKATGARLTEKTVFTEHRAMIGTLEYMSPEQAEGSLDIDTRTDVYSLGVVLYELLTGSTPFTGEDLRSASHAEIQRMICEVEPPTPSTRLGQSQETLHQVATHRQTVPRRLGTIVRGELDWIVMKCLEKDRTRRYDSASTLALDIERYLNHEPVLAGPPSATYRVRKFVRRNKLSVGAAAGIFLALAAGLVVSDSQRRRAVRAEALAAVRLADAETARDDAIKARDESDTVTKFFADTLASADPGKVGKDVTVREVIDQAAQTVGEKFKDKPLLNARLRDEIAATYYSLGLYPSAEAHAAEAAAIYRRTKGEQDPATLSAAGVLGLIIGARGEFSRSEAQHRANLEIERRVLGDEHSSTLGSMINLAASLHDQRRYAEAEELYRKTLEVQRRVQGEEHPDTLTSMNGLAASLHNQGRYAEAEELFRKALDVRRRVLGDEHPHTLQSTNNVTSSLAEQGRHVEAEELYRKILEVRRRVLGDEHPNTLTSMSNLAGSLHAQGRYSEAEALDRQTLEIRRRVLGEEHPITLQSMGNLAGSLFDQGRYAEAEALDRKTLEVRRRVLGEGHPETLESVAGLAAKLVAQEKPDEARVLFLELMAAQRKAAEGPSSNPKTLNALAWLFLTCALEDLRDPAAALPLAEKVVEATGGKVPDFLSTLALAYSLTGATDRAVETLRKALALLPEARTPLRTGLEGRLGEYLTQLKSWTEAESLLLGVQQALSEREYIPPEEMKESLERLGKLYQSWDAAEPGKGYAEKAEQWRKKLEEQNTETPESPKPESQTLMDEIPRNSEFV